MQGEREREEFEKELLGNSSRELFFGLKNETDKRFSEIKEKFFEVQNNNYEELFIETLLVDEKEAYKFGGAFYPIVSENQNISDIFNENIYLENVYLDVPYYQLKDIEEETFNAWIHTDDETYEIKVVLEKDMRYEKKIKRLYEAFELNGQNWNTINTAHIKRMYRIKVSDYDFEMTDKIYEGVVNKKYKIDYDFEYYDDNVIRGKKLLWNVEEKKIKSTIFIRPTKVDISFEYILKFDENEKLLVENNDKNDILCCYTGNKNELSIISRRDDNSIWKVFSIKSVELCRKIMEMNFNKENLDYIHFTNYREISFIDKIRKHYNNENGIRSKAYLEKKFFDYEFIKNNFELKDVVFNKEKEKNIDVYNCNEFLETDFDLFQKKGKIVLNLFVKCLNRNKYTEDMLSFIVSEIQWRMPEYDCRGYMI